MSTQDALDLYATMRAGGHSHFAAVNAAGYRYAEENGVSWRRGQLAIKKCLASDGKLRLNAQHDQTLRTLEQHFKR